MSSTNTIDEIKNRFSTIEEKISNEDRLEAAIKFRKHTETINRYVRGEFKKQAFALELLAFFIGRIKTREQILDTVNA